MQVVFSPGEEELAHTFERCCRDGARLLLIDDSELREAPNSCCAERCFAQSANNMLKIH